MKVIKSLKIPTHSGKFSLDLPLLSCVLSARMQGYDAYMSVRMDTSASENESRRFVWLPNDQDFDDADLVYVGSVIGTGGEERHLFEDFNLV